MRRWYSVKFSATFVVEGPGAFAREIKPRFFALKQPEFLFNETDTVQSECNKREQPLAAANGIQAGGNIHFMHQTRRFGFNKSWYNEPEYSPPQLTHRKKAES